MSWGFYLLARRCLGHVGGEEFMAVFVIVEDANGFFLFFYLDIAMYFYLDIAMYGIREGDVALILCWRALPVHARGGGPLFDLNSSLHA